MANPDLPALMEHVARALVDVPDEVSVEAFDEKDHVVLELLVAEEDLGRVIGRQGRMARSLRTILGSASSRGRKRYQLEIAE